jgi:hypothetical protein
MMPKYLVQLWSDGKAGKWEETYANSELEAAEKATGVELRAVGKIGELRARVRVAGDLSKESAFYAGQ